MRKQWQWCNLYASHFKFPLCRTSGLKPPHVPYVRSSRFTTRAPSGTFQLLRVYTHIGKRFSAIIGITLLVPFSIMLSGCQAVETSLTDVGSAAGGSALAYQLSNGNKVGTVMGAAGGVVLSKVGQAKVEKCLKAAYQRGYEDAMNQNVKQQYWIIQNRQKEDSWGYQKKSELIPVIIPEQWINGEIIQERVEYVRVERS